MTDSANTAPGRLDLNDAVNAILQPEDIKDTPSVEEVTPDESPKDESPAEEVSASEAATLSEDAQTDLDAEDSSEESEEEPEPEEEGEEEEEDESPAEETEEEEVEEPEAEEEEEETLFTTPDGDEVTLDELKRSYLRQSDYTKKTQALAEERTNLQQVNEQLGTQQNVLAENLTMALDIIEPQLAEFAKTDWNALAESDAYEYAEKRALFDQAQIRYNNVVNTSQQLVQHQNAQNQQQQQARLAEEGKALQMALPDMADPKKGKALRNSLRDYALANGLSEAEAGGIQDHRIIVMMNKARMFDEMSKSGIQMAKKKIAKSPKKVVKAGQPLTRTEKNQAALNKKRSRLNATGSVDDAVAVLLSK